MAMCRKERRRWGGMKERGGERRGRTARAGYWNRRAQRVFGVGLEWREGEGGQGGRSQQGLKGRIRDATRS